MIQYQKKIIPLILPLLFILAGCQKGEDKYYQYTLKLTDAFNTVNKVTLFTLGNTDKEILNNLASDMDQILYELDCKFNVQDRNDEIVTDLMLVNQNAGIEPIVVDKEVIRVLEAALDMADATAIDDVALYDPTIMPVSDLWDITNRQYNSLDNNKLKDEDLPNQEEIDHALGLVNYRDILIDKENSTVFLKEPGMKIDLGSIVKGYAADKIKQYLINQNFNKAVIDIGRNIATVGYFVNKELQDVPWKVGIQRPFASIFDQNYEKTAIVGTLSVVDLTLVTSGIYEKYILTESGNQYHHIFNPYTGYSMDNGVVSVTVVCEESINADALSTALFLLGIDKAMDLIDSLDYTVETIWILKNDKLSNYYDIYISPGLEDNFVFNNNVESKNYVYKGVYHEKTSN